jgi:D-amino-acid dehydrogenase
MSRDVVVIGAGVVGIATALELAACGASVTVLERGAGAAAGCSAGNAGIVGTSHVAPLAGPEALRDGMRYLARRNGPLLLKPRPAALPWLARFLHACAPARHQAAAEALTQLAQESAELHRELGERLATGFAHRGLLGVCERPETLAAELKHLGDAAEALDGRAACHAAPLLASEPAGAVFVAHEAHCDPERFVQTLAAAAVDLGVEVRTGVEVLGLRRRHGRVSALWTTAGDVLVGEVIVAAGAWSPALARDLPGVLPIQGGKGYHIDYAADPRDASMPVYFPEHRIVTTPLGDRLRVTGMLQLVGTDLRVSRGRVEAIAANASRSLTGMGQRRILRVWRGLRPCSPDGLPIVGRVPGVQNATLATGHGMWGLQLAPVTARLVSGLLAGTPDDRRLHALRPERFDLRSAARRRGTRRPVA